MKRKKRRTKQVILLVLSFEVLLIIVILGYIQFRPKVVKAITIEAGTTTVGVEDFFREKNSQGSIITDINSLDLNNPGTYVVQIKVGNKIYNSSIKVVDTIPPSATVGNQLILKNDKIDALAFVTDISDATTVTASFKEAPDATVFGDQEVTIVLEDTSKNRTELKAMLTVLDINSTVTIEAGSGMDITSSDFANNDKYSITVETDLQQLDISKPATHEIVLGVDGKTVKAYIEVIDTLPPTARVGNLTIFNGEIPEAITFVTDLVDETTVIAAYKEAPDFALLGDQTVTIILEDESGNQTEQTAILTVKEDTEAPVISGVTDKTTYIGQTVSYKSGVSVLDNKDKEVDFKVDSSTVNLKEAGAYQVSYSATDAAGNKATISATLTVVELIVSQETMNQMTEEILSSIVTEGMTQREIAYEIYHWTKGHLSYTGSSDKSDWFNEAYRGIKNGVGDCFTYFAVSQSLLIQAGIENKGVTRVGGETHHYWSLINCGDGWYHFDSCPNKDHKETFMMTDAEVDEYTALRGNNYYTFDKTLYPATPVE